MISKREKRRKDWLEKGAGKEKKRRKRKEEESSFLLPVASENSVWSHAKNS